MWGTSQGDRTLVGHEAALVRKSVGYLRDMITASIDQEEPFVSEVKIFSLLQTTQQLAVLHEVAFALLDPETPIVELTAVREATAYAIYQELISLIELEIDISRFSARPIGIPATLGKPVASNPGFQTRALVLAACQQVDERTNEWGREEFVETHAPPEIYSENIERWSELIEFLSNQVMWDHDFELESMFADHDPIQVAEIKAYFGIDEDYFSTPAPDAYSTEFQRIDRELVSLTSHGF